MLLSQCPLSLNILPAAPRFRLQDRFADSTHFHVLPANATAILSLSYLEAVDSGRDIYAGNVDERLELSVGVVSQERHHGDKALRVDHHLHRSNGQRHDGNRSAQTSGRGVGSPGLV